MLPRILIPIISVAVIVMIAFYGFTTGGYSIHAMLLVAPIALMLASNTGLILAFIIGLRYSDLIIPGLPQDLNMMDVFILFLVGLTIAGSSITKKRIVSWRLSHYFLIGFLVVLAGIITARGIGIRFFGSSDWGGFAYIKIFILSAFYLFCGQIRISGKQVRLATMLMLFLSLIPVGAQLLFYASGGAIYIQYMFLEAYATGLFSTLDAIQEGTGTARFYFSGLAWALLITGMVFFTLHTRDRIWLFLFMGLAFAMSLISGFRAATVGMGGIVFIFLLFQYPKKRVAITVATAMVALAALLLITPFYRDLHPGIQRALSWVPWYDIPAEIAYDAQYSIEWRIDVWKESMRYLPQYLFIGRGLTFNINELQAALSIRDTIGWAYVSHNYHSGPLSLAIITGIPGFIFFTLFMVMAGKEAFHGLGELRRTNAHPFTTRFYMAFLASVIYSIPSFFLIYGSVKTSVPAFLFSVSILQILRFNFGTSNTTPIRPILPAEAPLTGNKARPPTPFIRDRRFSR